MGQRTRRKRGWSIWVERCGKNWRCRWQGRHGSDQQIFVYRQDALELRDEKKRDFQRLDSGLPALPRKSRESVITLKAYIKEYLIWAKSHKAPATVSNFEAPALSDLLAFLGDVPLREISRADAERWKMETLKRLQPTTVGMRLRSLKAALSWSVTMGYLAANPLRGMAMPRTVPVGRILTAAELQALTRAVGPLLARAIIIACYTGLRRNELLALDWRQVQRPTDANWELHLEAQGTKAKRARVILLHPAAKAALGDPRPSGRVLEGLSVDMLEIGLRKAAKILKLGRVRFHDLRHTWATEYMMKTGDLPGLMLQGGWSSLAAVAKYQHLAKARREAILGLDFGLYSPILPLESNIDRSEKKQKE